MPSSRHALVAYVRHPVGEFVESLRRELHPVTAHMAAHLTILPPRRLRGSEKSALEFLEEACSQIVPFDVELGRARTFLPVTPTVFIEVLGSDRICQLHSQLGSTELCCDEEWPYVPHVTIVKMEQDEQAREAFEIARQRWAEFTGSRRIHIDELMFVREDGVGDWHDVAPLPLGRSLLSARP